jgi:hypothetical protein
VLGVYDLEAPTRVIFDDKSDGVAKENQVRLCMFFFPFNPMEPIDVDENFQPLDAQCFQ